MGATSFWTNWASDRSGKERHPPTSILCDCIERCKSDLRILLKEEPYHGGQMPNAITREFNVSVNVQKSYHCEKEDEDHEDICEEKCFTEDNMEENSSQTGGLKMATVHINSETEKKTMTTTYYGECNECKDSEGNNMEMYGSGANTCPDERNEDPCTKYSSLLVRFRKTKSGRWKPFEWRKISPWLATPNGDSGWQNSPGEAGFTPTDNEIAGEGGIMGGNSSYYGGDAQNGDEFGTMFGRHLRMNGTTAQNQTCKKVEELLSQCEESTELCCECGAAGK